MVLLAIQGDILMDYIHSRLQEDTRVLHVIVRLEDIAPGRHNLVDDGEFLQSAALHMEAGRQFPAH